MKVILSNEGRYNFHNVGSITVNVRPENFIWGKRKFLNSEVVKAVELTPSQIRRVRRHFCGMSDCMCGSCPDSWETIDNASATGERVIIHL